MHKSSGKQERSHSKEHREHREHKHHSTEHRHKSKHRHHDKHHDKDKKSKRDHHRYEFKPIEIDVARCDTEEGAITSQNLSKTRAYPVKSLFADNQKSVKSLFADPKPAKKLTPT